MSRHPEICRCCSSSWGHTHMLSATRGQVDTWLRPLGEARPRPAPFLLPVMLPSMSVYASSSVAQGNSPEAVTRLSPHPDASTGVPSCLAFLFEAHYCSGVLGRNVCPGAALLGGAGSDTLSSSIWVLGPEAGDLPK